MTEYINYNDIDNFSNIYNISYIKKGWKTQGKFKAVLHKFGHNPKPFFRLSDLKDYNAHYKHLKEINVIDEYGENIGKIYISANDFFHFKQFKKNNPVNGYDNSYTNDINYNDTEEVMNESLGLKKRQDGGWE